MRLLASLLLCGLAFASQAAPKVAVTDLAYEERVREYIHLISASDQAQVNGFSASASSSYREIEATYSYLERGELKKFTGDIKGEILKSGRFQLIQGKPYSKDNEGLHDIIGRIRNGDFKGADYVLFGTLSDLDFRQDFNALQHSDNYSKVFSLTLVAEFSLIDTRTLEIISAFSALGEGQDTKLVSAADGRLTPNRGRVIRDVSLSLGSDVARQLQQQLGDGVSLNGAARAGTQPGLPVDTAPVILR
ncbi:penicillin-binding protein activator LpoB [Pseudomonas sp. CBC3]|uniref:penicillin-binding protein activator LpoB n=1 Tax=Pseudomonas sp. CBC3 TaxID=3123318 RepID=UPI0030E788B0